MKPVVVVLLLLLFPTLAPAQAIDHIDVFAVGGKSVTTWHGQADLQALNVEFVHALSPRSEVAFVVSPTTLWQPRSWFGEEFGDGNERVRAIAAALLFRRNFNQDSSRIGYYVEGGTGPMYAEKSVPASTSRFNFVTQAGAGVVLLPRAKMPVVVGYRFLHISNGGYAPRNPGLNMSSVIFGVRWRR